MARAAIYLRVSTDEQAHSAGAQEEGARAWCAAHGHDVVACYRDVGISGADFVNRAGLLDLQLGARTKPCPWDFGRCQGCCRRSV